MQDQHASDTASLRPQFNQGGALQLFEALLAKQLAVEMLRIATAYFGVQAMLYLENHVQDVDLRLLMGFGGLERAQQSVDPVHYFEQTVRQGLADDVLHAAQLLLDAIENRGAVVKVFRSRYRHDLHAKIYIANTLAA